MKQTAFYADYKPVLSNAKPRFTQQKHRNRLLYCVG